MEAPTPNTYDEVKARLARLYDFENIRTQVDETVKLVINHHKDSPDHSLIAEITATLPGLMFLTAGIESTLHKMGWICGCNFKPLIGKEKGIPDTIAKRTWWIEVIAFPDQ